MPPPARQDPPPSGASPRQRGYAILIVESHAPFRDYLQRALRARFPSHALSAAAGARQALTLVDTARPDLVFTDVRLRDGDGFALTRSLRRMSVNAKVVFLSGHDLPEYRAEALRCGADQYLEKRTLRIDDIFAVVPTGGAPQRAP